MPSRKTLIFQFATTTAINKNTWHANLKFVQQIEHTIANAMLNLKIPVPKHQIPPKNFFFRKKSFPKAVFLTSYCPAYAIFSSPQPSTCYF